MCVCTVLVIGHIMRSLIIIILYLFCCRSTLILLHNILCPNWYNDYNIMLLLMHMTNVHMHCTFTVSSLLSKDDLVDSAVH